MELVIFGSSYLFQILINSNIFQQSLFIKYYNITFIWELNRVHLHCSGLVTVLLQILL